MHVPRAIMFCLSKFLLFLNYHLSKAIPGSTGPIFTKFSPYGRYLIADYRSDPVIILLPWQQILWSKMAKSADSYLFVTLASQNGWEILPF